MPKCACGVQLVHAYNTIAERNDASLFHYGFVQDLDPPLLAALDTPSGNLYDPTTYTEADYGRHYEGCCSLVCMASVCYPLNGPPTAGSAGHTSGNLYDPPIHHRG